ncbi:MAG: hypothetical protein IH946_03550 [Bacteroidetes bacterium]|nr:hypothetical protein [Bacteroidota bacterium]
MGLLEILISLFFFFGVIDINEAGAIYCGPQPQASAIIMAATTELLSDPNTSQDVLNFLQSNDPNDLDQDLLTKLQTTWIIILDELNNGICSGGNQTQSAH